MPEVLNGIVPQAGSMWVWEPLKDHARETVIVTDVRWNGEEAWVETMSRDGRKCLNELSRWVEATVHLLNPDEAVPFVEIVERAGGYCPQPLPESQEDAFDAWHDEHGAARTYEWERDAFFAGWAARGLLVTPPAADVAINARALFERIKAESGSVADLPLLAELNAFLDRRTASFSPETETL